jgi:hypothetical protein
MNTTSNGHQPFNPNDHLMNLETNPNKPRRDYLAVQWRLVWFREQCPEGTIDTEELEYDIDREITKEGQVWNQQKRAYEKVTKTAKGYARYKAIVTDGKGGRATGHGSESAVDFTEFGEKAETKAIGRALAALGYGTQFAGQELDEGTRIVDAPVERSAQDSADERNAIIQEVKSLGLATDTASWQAWKRKHLGRDVTNAQLTPADMAQLRKAIEEYKDSLEPAA